MLYTFIVHLDLLLVLLWLRTHFILPEGFFLLSAKPPLCLYPHLRWGISFQIIKKTNYAHSQARAFLNGLSFGYGQNEFGSETVNKKWENKGFLQSAFTSAAQGKIAVTTVDNSAASAGTLYTRDSALCENTKDKVFLLSGKEVSTVEYGFPKDDKNGSTRIRNLTGYAKSNFKDWNGMNYYWWLRTPEDDDCTYTVSQGDYDANMNGRISGFIGTFWTIVGIVPALTISY